jgi:hypothetical protein
MCTRLHGLRGLATSDLLAADRFRTFAPPLVVDICAGPFRPPDVRACRIAGSGPGQHTSKHQRFPGNRDNGKSVGARSDVLDPDLRQALARIRHDISHNRRGLW